MKKPRYSNLRVGRECSHLSSSSGNAKTGLSVTALLVFARLRVAIQAMASDLATFVTACGTLDGESLLLLSYQGNRILASPTGFEPVLSP
jgi:hypothetical protein